MTYLIAYSLMFPFLDALFMLAYRDLYSHQRGKANRELSLGFSPCSQSLFQCLSLACSQTNLRWQIKTGQLKLLLLPASLLFLLTNVITIDAVVMDTIAAAPCVFSGSLQKPSKNTWF